MVSLEFTTTRYALAGAALALVAALPASMSFASEAGIAVATLTLPISADQARTAMLTSDEGQQIVSTTDSSEPADAAPLVEPAESATLDAELECMAKIVHHEAANQSRDGQRAVAQVILNRVASGRFPTTICGVAHQPGQFFDTRRYNPRRDTATWVTAVEVAREVRDGERRDVVPANALFYHAAYQPPTRFFRTRTRVATLGDHVFYR